jgi:hypothetical protein
MRKQPHPHYAPRGHHSATLDPDVITQWPAHANIGIACAASGLIVIDVDRRNNPDSAILEELPATMTVGTADGWHAYFTTGPLVGVRGKLCDGIDIKYNGYVLAPPSIHPDRVAYRLLDDIDPVPLPGHLLERIMK